MTTQRITTRVAALRDEAPGIRSFALVRPHGGVLPAFAEGEPDLRDIVFSAEERRLFPTACVSRCRSGRLVLDPP